MITALYAQNGNSDFFKIAEFGTGLNLVVAERAQDSSSQETRNGLGKTTLLHAIDFCLGSSKQKGVFPSGGWSFRLDLTLNDKPYSVTRYVDADKMIIVDGDVSGWPIPADNNPDLIFRTVEYNVEHWRQLLGLFTFDLPLILPQESPMSELGISYRSLVTHFMRTTFSDAVVARPHVPETSARTQIAYLLALECEFVGLQMRLEKLRDEQEQARDAVERELSEEGKSLTLVRNEMLECEERIAANQRSIDTLDLGPAYGQLTVDIGKVSSEIHALEARVLAERRQLARAEADSRAMLSTDDVKKLFEDYGASIGAAEKTLQEVEEFHRRLNLNRKTILLEEAALLKKSISDKQKRLATRYTEFREATQILRSNQVFLEYQILQDRVSRAQRQYDALKASVTRYENAVARIRALTEELQGVVQSAIESFERIKANITDVQDCFAEFVQAAYDGEQANGELSVTLKRNGMKAIYRIEPHIASASSTGITHMGIVMFDVSLFLGQAKRGHAIDFLVHDSAIFDAIDTRQLATTLRTVHQMMQKRNLQYICSFNSNTLDDPEFAAIFPREETRALTRLTLKDDSPEHRLLRIAY